MTSILFSTKARANSVRSTITPHPVELPCSASPRGCGSCAAAMASPPTTPPELLLDCRQHNISAVLAPNERDCPVKQNEKEVFLCLSLISRISACPLNSSAHRSRFPLCVAAGRIISCVTSGASKAGPSGCRCDRGTDLRPSPSGECCRQYSRIKDSADVDAVRQRTVAVSQHTVQSSALMVGTAGAGDTRTR